ncbi:hypothetical protein [Mycobacterium sp. URHB0021]
MWIVEVNFVGRRFTYVVPRRRPLLRFGQRSIGWRPSAAPDPRAA